MELLLHGQEKLGGLVLCGRKEIEKAFEDSELLEQAILNSFRSAFLEWVVCK